MLRILQVVGKMDRAGTETIIMNLYRNIDREKVQFDFMVFTDEKADYDDEIEALGGKIYRMPQFKLYNYPQMCAEFNRFFKEHPYKVVHGHIGSMAPAYLHYAKKYGAYTVAHSHSTDFQSLIPKLCFRLLTRWVIFVADYFFACSVPAGESRFGKRVTKQKNFSILKNAIQAADFSYTKERHDKLKADFGLTDKVVFGHIGRLTEVKNHSFLLDVFKAVKERMPNAVLLLAGRGPLEDKIKEKISAEGLKDSVKMLGIRNDIPDLMNLFDVFIFPSIFEGLGIVGIEAQAAGLPCFFSEGIPQEAIITDHARRLPITISADEWADEIVKEISGFERKNDYDAVAKSGFDIVSSANRLQNFYIENSK